MRTINFSEDDPPFSYTVSRNGRVFIAWQGKVVTTLAGREAERFLSRVESTDFVGQQGLMARATGNFKRGNEKLASTVKDSRGRS